MVPPARHIFQLGGRSGVLHLLNLILPPAVLQDRRLNRTSVFVYFGMRAHRKTTIKGYAEVLNMPYKTVYDAIRNLHEADWVYSYPDPGTGRRIWVPGMPLDVELYVEREFESNLQTASNKGETIMKAQLDYLVDDHNYVNNHRFKLGNPLDANAKQEHDRTYKDAKVVIEFQGRQHFEVVQFRSGETNLEKTMAWDRAKQIACKRNGYTYVEIAAYELSWATLRTKLDGLLPLLQPPEDRPLFKKLEALAEDHATWASTQSTSPRRRSDWNMP